MAISTTRAAKKSDDWLINNQTAAHVAPGTYSNTHNEPAPPPLESAVPFSSLQEKVLNQNVGTMAITPGPGAYIGQTLLNSANRRANGDDNPGIGAISLKSSVARIGPTAPGSSVYLPSNMETNPGPGIYDVAGKIERKQKKDAMGPVKPVIEGIEKTTPSIPLRRLLPGQRPEQEGGEADVATLVMRHTGERGDTVGPGEYEPKGDAIVHRTQPQTTFHHVPPEKSRGLWEPTVGIESTITQRDLPGPGAYEPKGHTIADKFNVQDGGDILNTYQFASRSNLPFQKGELKLEKSVPGPGQYEMKAEIDQTVKSAREKGIGGSAGSFLGGMSERVGWSRAVDQPFKDPYHARNVPGPGHYTEGPSCFPVDPRKGEAEKVLPDVVRKRFHGVHHPTIIMALQEAQGPLQAFNSSGDRPCNKELEQSTPAPWEYDREEAVGSSIAANLREKAKVGRRGVFGSCADRFFGSPLAGQQGLPDPGADFEADKLSGANSEPRSMFQSQTPRLRDPPGAGEAYAVKLGSFNTPAPGAYMVEKEPDYRSPFRHPRREHLSFGSSEHRFHGAKDVFTGQTIPASNPGPGDYRSVVPQQRVRGAAGGDKAARGVKALGCTSDTVGPGSYGGGIETSMLKKTFNVSMQAPVNSSATPRRYGGIVGRA